MSSLPTLSETVKEFGLSADKRLGQHFLLDQNITDKIARLALPLETSHVAEIGPGPGGLTRSLLGAGAKSVLAIETDERFVEPLEMVAAHFPGRLKILQADALKVHIPDYLPDSIKITANLPYNVGTQMLINWLTATPLFWEVAVLMFQKEVAERIVVGPGEKAYGRLAVLAQSVCLCNLAFDVPARAFTPPPKVDSAVVVLEPLPEARRFENLERLGEVSQAAFGQRRKMLRKSLRTIAEKYDVDLGEWLAECGINPTERPERLPVEAFQGLASSLPALNE